MDREQLINRLFQVVAFDLRHKHYAYTVDKATLYTQLVAGKDIDKLLKQFVRREDTDEFAQRVRLTQHITVGVCKNLLDIFFKIPRSNAARKTLTYSGENAENLKRELVDVLGNFWGDASYDAYIYARYIELNATDPNSFVVFEWQAFDNTVELLQPYPFEVSSRAAVDYTYENNTLQYLIVEQSHLYATDNIMSDNIPVLRRPTDGKTEGKKYTAYGKNETYQLLQIAENDVSNALPVDGGVIKTVYKGAIINAVKLNGKVFQFLESAAPHNLGHVPAFRVGYCRDLATNGETMVSMLYAVEAHLLKTIKANSEFDLVAALLAFPQVVKMSEKCDDESCYKGRHSTDGSLCGTCLGTGFKKTAFSAQDAIVLELPENRENAIKITDVITYVYPPVEIVKWQEEYIERLTQKCKQIMFNSDVFSRQEIADTATGKNLDMQNVYDTLYPFSEAIAYTWVFGVTTIAELIDRADNLVVGFKFDKDLKLKSLEDLMFDLSVAVNLNNPTLTAHFNDDVAGIIYHDRPIELLRYQTQQLYNPFSGKTQSEILLLMASAFVQNTDKILYANYGSIFDLLELDYAGKQQNFYLLPRDKQRQALYAKVAEIKAEIDAETPEPVLALE